MMQHVYTILSTLYLTAAEHAYWAYHEAALDEWLWRIGLNRSRSLIHFSTTQQLHNPFTGIHEYLK